MIITILYGLYYDKSNHKLSYISSNDFLSGKISNKTSQDQNINFFIKITIRFPEAVDDLAHLDNSC